MDASPRNQYLNSEVLSASPQKLHLLLIEAVMRALRRGKQHWRLSENDKACAALIRAQRMVCEILGGFNREASPDLVRRMSNLYAFVFRLIVDGNRYRDEKKLDDALRILEVERGTWQAVCEQLGGAAGGGAGSASGRPDRDVAIDPPQRGLPARSRPHGPPLGDGSPLDNRPGQGFSWQA
jgi:flagellar protein FliS